MTAQLRRVSASLFKGWPDGDETYACCLTELLELGQLAGSHQQRNLLDKCLPAQAGMAPSDYLASELHRNLSSVLLSMTAAS